MASPVPGEDVDDRSVDESAAQERFVWRARVRANPTAYAFYRAGVGLLGLLVVATGIVLLPLPGPGWVIIFVGIGIWATEFAWAGRLLRFTKEQVFRWTRWVGRQNVFVQGLVSLGVALFVVVCFWLVLLVSGVPGFLPGQVDDWLGHVPGL